MRADRRLALGGLGERLAEEHLTGAGYRIVERNFRTRYGELDIVAADERGLVFCEVKTRVGGARAGRPGPLDAIGPAKRRRLRLMASQWLASRSGGGRRPPGIGGPDLRFDAIGVTVTRTGTLIALEHLEDAF